MNKVVFNFIKQNQDMIRDSAFDGLYAVADVGNPTRKIESLTAENIGLLSETFRRANINPLMFMSHVPENYFYGNYYLDEIVVPGNCKNIGSYAFGGTSITKAILEEGVQSISYNAFFRCPRLKRVVLPPSVDFIEEDAIHPHDYKLEIVCAPNSYADRWAREQHKFTIINTNNFTGW